MQLVDEARISSAQRSRTQLRRYRRRVGSARPQARRAGRCERIDTNAGARRACSRAEETMDRAEAEREPTGARCEPAATSATSVAQAASPSTGVAAHSNSETKIARDQRGTRLMAC
jgi:hypothetical protein